MAVLSIIAIIYGALVSLMQKDWKKLVAYSSVSHLGFCTLGIFALNQSGHRRLHPPADQPRHLHRHALPDRRRRLRAAPHARDRRVRRAGARDAVFTIVFLIAMLSSMGCRC
jgi:NADH-quinone oxidoreductase subunit M